MDQKLKGDWKIIGDTATVVLQSVAVEEVSPRRAAAAAAAGGPGGTVVEAPGKVERPAADDELIQRKRDRLRRRDFGLSLLLSNVPMSPKFINGSFAALFDHVDIVAEYARHISRS